MRTAAPLLAAMLLALPAAAEPPRSCASGRAKVAVSKDLTRLRLRGAISPDAAFDPVANGLVLEVAFEPEADPANTAWSAMLPAAGFQASGRGVVYKDPAGTVDGITLARITPRKGGGSQIVVARRGGAITALGRTGTVRAILMAGGCVRNCGTPCTTDRRGRVRCKAGGDKVLCGVMSGCELLNIVDGQFQGRECMLPYPSSVYEQDDTTTPTGKRIHFLRRAMPANMSGVHIDPTAWNILDGYSPGPVLTAYWAQGVELAASGIPSHTDFAASLAPSSPTVLIEADSPGCVRVEHFGENDVSTDANGQPLAPPEQAFVIRPGRRLKNGTRYIVALRGLVGQDGQPIPPGTAFKALRDGKRARNAAVEARRERFDGMFEKLEADCGIARSSLGLAWDFTTASDDSLNRWLLHMRDQSFAQLGTGAPAFTVAPVENDPFAGDARVCRRVTGTYTVPLWTTANAPGAVLNIDPVTNLPVQNGVATDVPFTAMIPCSLITPTPTPGRPIFYGHGLLGSRNEVTAGNLRTLANTYGFVLAATDWQGFATTDVGTILGFITDLSGFPKLSERLHQGILNQLYLARLLKSPAGFASHAAFQENGTPLIDTSDVYYYGISQGGIEGGVVMALAQDATRGVLGVPAANYSTLLHRSVDFELYFNFLRAAYPEGVERGLTLPLIQQLWDKSEPNGWYHHTIPGSLPNTPPHKVLVHMATSDAEVTNLGTTIMVRSMGVAQVGPVVKSYFGIPEQTGPFDASALLESDGAYGPVPVTNTPPAENDAHGSMRARAAIQAQIDLFLRPDGTVRNFCDGACDPE